MQHTHVEAVVVGLQISIAGLEFFFFLKWHGHFHFGKGTSIGKSEIQWETFEAPRLGATETMVLMACLYLQA